MSNHSFFGSHGVLLLSRYNAHWNLTHWRHYGYRFYANCKANTISKHNDLLTLCCEYAYLTIVFSCVYLEAFIYDYAASSTSDTYIKKYLDKLNYISKWIIYPKLITGKEIDRCAEPFQLLNELNDMRNDIVHLKSSNIPDDNEIFQKLDQNRIELFKVASNAKKSIYSILSELKEIDPGHPKFAFKDLEKFK